MVCGASWAGDSGQAAGVGVDSTGVAPSDMLTVTTGSQPVVPQAEVRCFQPLREGKCGRGMREQEDEMAPSSHLIGPKQANRKTNKTSGLETEVVFIFWLWIIMCALSLRVTVNK